MRQYNSPFILIFFCLFSSVTYAAGDWPIERGHDARGFQTLPLFAGAPKVLTYPLKGLSPSWAISLSTSTTDIIIYPDQNGISGHSFDGKINWHRSLDVLPDTWLTPAPNGPKELLAHTEGGSDIYLLDPKTGDTIWKGEVPNKIYAWQIHAGKFIPDLPGEQISVVSGQAGGDAQAKNTASLFAINPDSQGKLLWQTVINVPSSDNPIVTWPQSAIGDVENNGQNSLVTLIRNGLVVQDIRTGKIQYKSTSLMNEDRNYGALYISNLTKDGKNEIVVLADKLAQHIDVIKYNGQTFTLQWHHNYGSSWPQEKYYLHVPGSSELQHVINTNTKDIVYSLWTKENGWCLHVENSLTGNDVATYPGLFALWSGHISSEDHSQVIALKTDKLSPSKFGTVEILDFTNPQQPVIWQQNNIHMEGYYGWPASRPNFLSHLTHYSSQSQYDFFPFLLTKDSNTLPTLLYTDDGKNMGSASQLWTLSFDSQQNKLLSQKILDMNPLQDPKILYAKEKPSGDIDLVIGTNNKKVSVVSTQTGQINQFDGNDSNASYFSLLANLTDEKNNTLLVENGNFINAFTIDNAKNTLNNLWQIKGKLLAIGDVVTPGVNDVIAAVPGANGSMWVSAIDGNGNTIWSTELPELSYTNEFEPIHAATLGHFLGNKNDDVYISGRLGPATGNGDMNISWMLNGQTGKIVWEKNLLTAIDNSGTHVFHTLGPDAAQTHTGGALALDIDDNGRDDLILTSQVYFTVLDGLTGNQLYNPILTSYALQLGHYSSYIWTSYASLIRLPSQDGKPPSILVISPYVWGGLIFKENTLFGLPTPTTALWQNSGYQPFTLPTVLPSSTSDEQYIMTLDGGIHIYSSIDGQEKFSFECPNATYGSGVNLSADDGIGLVITQGSMIGLHQFKNNSLKNIWNIKFNAPLDIPIIGSFTNPDYSDVIVTDQGGNLHILSGSA